MMGWTLTLKAKVEEDFDAAGLTALTHAMSDVEVAKIQLPTTRGQRLVTSTSSVSAGDLFRIERRDDAQCVLRGDFSRLHRIGARWQHRPLRVEGSVGSGLGVSMRGGSIDVEGHAGCGVATQLIGGTIRVSGNVGDDLGGPLPGRRSGMSGGRVIVKGNAGNAVGFRLRRGLIVIDGDCGDAVGCDMVAGSIVITGHVGTHAGAGMRRGTLILGHEPTLAPARFSSPRDVTLGVAMLMASDINDDAPAMASRLRSPSMKRSLGDLSAGGRGEVWWFSP
jgi:formylmethanofuran dehydrogenase subunit C